MFKSILLGSISILASVAAASAADLPSRKDAPFAPAVVSSYSWAGWYAGGNIGYGWGNPTGSGYYYGTPNGGNNGPTLYGSFNGGGLLENPTSNILPSLLPRGIIGGAQVGYNWQITPMMVAGFVADFQEADIKASGIATVPSGSFVTNTESKSVKLDWFGTVRANAGVIVLPNLYAYGTGGLAYGHLKTRTSFNDPTYGGGGAFSTSGSSAPTKIGWTLGAGLEYRISSAWTIGAEYLYVNFGRSKTVESFATGYPVATILYSHSKFSDNIARVTFNYHFGADPVVAKY